MGLFDKLKAGLARTAQQFQQRFEALVEQADAPEQRTRAVDVNTLEALEELLSGEAATNGCSGAVGLKLNGLRQSRDGSVMRVGPSRLE